MPLNVTSHKADSQICLCSVMHLTHALLYNLKLTEELQRLLKMSYWWLWSNLENKREKTWDSYFQSNFTASYIITKYILLITYKFPDCQIHPRFSQTVYDFVLHRSTSVLPLSSALWLRAVSYHSLYPSPVVWFSLCIYRYPHFFCPTMCKLQPFMLPCSPFFRTKSHKLFLWRKITELTKPFFSVISEQKILSTLMQRIPFKIMSPSSIGQSN